MQINIRYKENKVRRKNSHLYQGEEKFTGGKTYQVVGTYDHQDVRLSLGTDEKNVAIRRITKIEKAVSEGPTSGLWSELTDSLPSKTFEFFASRIGYNSPSRQKLNRPTFQDLSDAFEADMQQRIDNKKRGASPEEGVMSDSTRERYRQTVRQFQAFLGDNQTPLDSISSALIIKYKNARYKQITAKKQSRGGGSVALDIALLHRMFALAVELRLMTENPIHLKKESKPGKNPKNGARPFTAEELTKLRKAVVWKQVGQAAIDDSFMFLLLRWTGLRRSDCIRLLWQDVQFGRGANGEIEIMTQKRGKLAVIPLSTELRQALEHEKSDRKAKPEDYVLLNPATNSPFTSGTRVTERCKALGTRAGVKRCTPHCFRDTFACDMLAKGAGVFEVAKMLADTVETVEQYYAQFVPAARDNIQSKMDNGIGIEEQAELQARRGKKIVEIGRR